MDRLGKFECVWFAIIHLLEHGTYWAQGHAARTLGNLITSPENLKIFAKIDASNTAAQSLNSMLHDPDTSLENKEKSLHAIGNMVRSSVFCNVFGRVGGLQETLEKMEQAGMPKAAIDRVTTCMSQHRLGTRTWRPATKMA